MVATVAVINVLGPLIEPVSSVIVPDPSRILKLLNRVMVVSAPAPIGIVSIKSVPGTSGIPNCSQINTAGTITGSSCIIIGMPTLEAIREVDDGIGEVDPPNL